MEKFSLATFVVALVLVNGDSPSIVENHQSAPVLKIIGRTNEESEKVPSSAEDLKTLCNCFRTSEPPYSSCSFKVPVAVIINGTCLGDAQLFQSFEERHQDNQTLTSSQYLGGHGCESAKVLLLESSGQQGSEHNTTASSVWLCRDSLDASLQELVITGVDEIKIAPGILTRRLTDFTLRLDGTYEKLAFPQGALEVKIEEITNVRYCQPQIKVVVGHATRVTFETESVLAPRVWVEVQHTRKLIIETKGVKADQDLILHVSSTKALHMKTRAAIINKLQVTNVSYFELNEESVTVMTSDGQLTMRDVQDIAAHENSIILGNGATLELANVYFYSLYNRSFVAQSPLGSVILSGVTAKNFNKHLCLATHSLALHNVTMSGCLRFVKRTEKSAAEESLMALCEVSSTEAMADPCQCTDPRCRLCAGLDSEHTTVLPCHVPPTISNVFTQRRRPHIHTVSKAVTEEEEKNWWEKPFYLGPLVALILVALVLLPYCIYRLLKRSQKGSYELTQQADKRGTFQRTIITPDNLHDDHEAPVQAPPHYHHDHGASRELFLSYRTLHDPTFHHHDPPDDDLSWGYGMPPHGHGAAQRQGHQRDFIHQHSSIMTPEDSHSLSSSSSMTI